MIAGDSPEALALLPSLEANPVVEISAFVTADPQRTGALLSRQDAALAARLARRITSDVRAALAIPGLIAVVDGGAPPGVREELDGLRGVQVLTVGLARTLFGHGPVNAYSKPDLLQTLREILLSAELTRDRRSVLDLVLQVAVAATGADRGSLLLWDARDGVLRVSTALGIEEEILGKIRIRPGEGIAGRAFQDRRAILLQGKADHHRWRILRERDDVESAISAPLLHGDEVLGVLNLSHARNARQFDGDELRFVEELARLDARILASAGEFGRLLRESRQNRLEAELRRILASSRPLEQRLHEVCGKLCAGLGASLGELWLGTDGALVLGGSSEAARAAGVRPDPGLVGAAAAKGRAVWLTGCGPDRRLRVAALPLHDTDRTAGVLYLQGVREAGEDAMEAQWSAAASLLAGLLGEALAEEETRRAARRGLDLAEAISALSTSPDRRQAADQLTSSAVLLLSADDAVLRMRQETSSRFPVVAWTGSGKWRRAPFAELERKLASEAMRTRQAQRAEAMAADGGPPVFGLALPVLRQGWVVGSLCALGHAGDRRRGEAGFDGSDEEILARLLRCTEAVLVAPSVAVPASRPDDRAAFRQRLGLELARARNRGHRVLLLGIEIPGLLAFESAHPKAAAVGDRLREALREFDLVARVGEDRFAVLVPEPDEETTTLLSRLGRALRTTLDRDIASPPCPVLRMGYAAFPEDGAEAAALEAKAARPSVEVS